MIVLLTDKGEELIKEIFPTHSALLSSLFDALSDEELELFRDMLKRISAAARVK